MSMWQKRHKTDRSIESPENMVEGDFLDPDEEFENIGPQLRDWKGIVIALVVIVCICSLIALAVYFFAPPSSLTLIDDSRSPVKLSNLSGLQSPISNVRWSDSDSIIYIDGRKGLHKLDINIGKSELLLDISSLGAADKHTISPDVQYIALLKATSEKIRDKFSMTYRTKIVDLISGSHYFVGITKTPNDTHRIFKWSPTGSDFIYWQDGDLYYSESPESKFSVRISDGGPDWIHGIFEWVYEEEIFGRKSNAVWWSPSGEKIAFLSRPSRVANEQHIPLISYSSEELYPHVLTLPYPKSFAQHLPNYVIKIWDKISQNLKQMEVVGLEQKELSYLFGVRWVTIKGKEFLIAIYANRYQNFIWVTICDSERAICQPVATHSYGPSKWAEPSDFSSILSNDDAIYMILPLTKSDGYGYQQIARLPISMVNQTTFKWEQFSFLSVGDFDVIQLEAIDKVTDTIYFTASAPSPTNRHLFATSASSQPMEEKWRCVSCIFKNCTYQNNMIDTTFKRLLTDCQGPSPPHYYISDLTQNKIKNVTRILQAVKYEEHLAKFMWPIEIEETLTLRNGFEAIVKILLPAGLKINSSRTLPVLIKVYGGPNSQSVSDEFSIGFDQVIVTDLQYALVKIDGRGSSSRGWKYLSAIYGLLGGPEMEDQIEAIRILMKKYPILDKTRLSIYGMSYGGYAAVKAAELAPSGFFKCAISVSPVSNFMYYDTAYSERYMGNSSPAQYNRGDITTDIFNFKVTRLLLIHGLYDDNVHFQNSALLMEALQQANIDFDLMVYPNEDHSIRKLHMYLKITTFLEKCAQH